MEGENGRDLGGVQSFQDRGHGLGRDCRIPKAQPFQPQFQNATAGTTLTPSRLPPGFDSSFVPGQNYGSNPTPSQHSTATNNTKTKGLPPPPMHTLNLPPKPPKPKTKGLPPPPMHSSEPEPKPSQHNPKPKPNPKKNLPPPPMHESQPLPYQLQQQQQNNQLNANPSSSSSCSPNTTPKPTPPRPPPKTRLLDPNSRSPPSYGAGRNIRLLHVAEKPSIASSIAKALSSTSNDFQSERGIMNTHTFTTTSLPFHPSPNASSCSHIVTSVAGHVFNVDFSDQFQSWESCSPDELFQAPTVKKPCKGSLLKHLQTCYKNCDYLVLWMDCDREGENINFEVLTVLGITSEPGWSRVYRAKFSAIAESDILKVRGVASEASLGAK